MFKRQVQYKVILQMGFERGMSNKLFRCQVGLDKHCIFEICFDKETRINFKALKHALLNLYK